MSSDQQIYVVDTNIIVDYVDIIPNGHEKQREEPTIDLSQAHIVIPTAVIRELSSFKRENSERGKTARIALRRLRKLFEGEVRSMKEAYNLEAPIKTYNEGQLFSILPVHGNFYRNLPFQPSEDDMDGQIILATLAAYCVTHGTPIDGTITGRELYDVLQNKDEVTLLTNDNGLAIRARERGIYTSRYGYKYP